MRELFNDNQKKFIKDNYINMSYKEIAECLNYTERQIRGWINLNCPNKNRDFNKKYFSEIETPNQAYWLGFIYADGWVICNKKTSNYELGIELARTDEQQLIDFNKELGNSHIITYNHKEKYICGNKNISITETVLIRIYSKQIVLDLIKNNVLENKTLKSNYPIVKDKLFFDFLRGYIDGDGCIYVREDKISHSQVHITSSHREILDYIKNKLMKYGIKSEVYQEKEMKYRLYINYKQALKLLDLIY